MPESSSSSPSPVSRPGKRRLTRWALYAGLVLVVAVAVYELLHWFTHVYEPNAIVDANFTVLSSSVNGNVESIHARRGDLVEPGQRLASMRSAVAALDVRALEAELEKERAARRQVDAELAFFNAELDDRIATAEESVKLLEREYHTLQARLRIARTNVQRNSELLSKAVVPRQHIDDANDKLLEVTSQLRDLETSIKVNERKLQELRGQRVRDKVYRSRRAVIDRNIDKTTVQLEQSRQRLEDMHIYSPMRAVVNEVYVNPGAYVEDGDRVFLLHDPDDVWIEAHVDESEIRHVRVGQPVEIEFDAYPFQEFVGRVRSVSRVTTAKIAAAPRAESADGGARTTQRIPVIIDLPPMDAPIWPGMRAAVNIVIR